MCKRGTVRYNSYSNDALFLAVATRLRVTAIVSADSIFRNVQGIILYAPDDING
ncbi:MAG: hypothetical protein ACYDEE_06240 [Ignavibacteriaceae bacterium]